MEMKKNSTKIFFALLFLLIVFGLAQAYKASEQQLRDANNGSIVVTPTPAYVYDPAPVVVPPAPKPVIQQPTSPKPAPVAVPGACYVGGCSGQICSDQPAMASTCEFREEYACYKSNITTCERQANGQCGWTQTAALAQCLEENPQQIQFQ